MGLVCEGVKERILDLDSFWFIFPGSDRSEEDTVYYDDGDFGEDMGLVVLISWW